MMIGR